MNNELGTENKLLSDAWEAGQKAIYDALGDGHQTAENLWLITMLSVRAVITNYGKADKIDVVLLSCEFEDAVKHMADKLLAATPVRH